MTDRELIAQFQAGDEAGFTVLYRRHNSQVRVIANRFLRNSVDAEDVAQEVWFRVSKALLRYKPQAKFTTWLYIITRNTSINWLRNHRFDALHSKFDEVYYNSPEPAPDTNLHLEDINRTLTTIVPLCRRLLELFITGCAYAEIAAITDCSLGTVKSRIHRARRQISNLPSTKEHYYNDYTDQRDCCKPNYRSG